MKTKTGKLKMGNTTYYDYANEVDRRNKGFNDTLSIYVERFIIKRVIVQQIISEPEKPTTKTGEIK